MKPERIQSLNKDFENREPREILEYFVSEFEGRIGLSSSLSLEDQILTSMCAAFKPVPRIFTLDTGRMFPEVYELIAKTNETYKLDIEVFFPEASQVESMVNEKGINLFYESIENRKLCCSIRKIEPLKRALQGLDMWICGMRADQSITRINTKILEWDEANGLLKLSPLIYWNEDQVWRYIRDNKIPYNPLHDKAYPSIGCQPCTRPVGPGEDLRSGRWWWEEKENKECGLHNSPKK